MSGKFKVGYDGAHRRVHIYNEGAALCPGFKEIGTFEANIDKDNNQVQKGSLSDSSGDHIYIRKANDLLSEHGVTDFANMRYEDKASNEPLYDEVKTITEVENENRDTLQNKDEAAADLEKGEAKPVKKKAGRPKKTV